VGWLLLGADAQRIATVFARSFVHLNDVLDRDQRLNVVNAIENETSAGPKSSQALTDFIPNVFASAEGKRALGIHATAPEGNPVTEFRFELSWIHVRRRALDGVENIESGRYKIFHERPHRATGMYERLPECMLVHPVV
jgi:hypothetical protein